MLKAKYPSIRPSLLLDFANTQILDPRINFTRASTGTYMNAEGVLATAGVNAPRFDFSPDTEECLGLLLEESRTNLFTYSEQIDNASWLKSSASVTANIATAPDGTLSADKLVGDTAANIHYVRQSISATTGNYTISVYAKAAEQNIYNQVRLYFVSNASSANNCHTGSFDLVSGSWLNNMANDGIGYSYVSRDAVSIGNGWWRISFTATVPTETVQGRVYHALNGGVNGASDGVSGPLFWGAQLEAGSFATSYIPTVASQVTRASDYAYVNMSSLGGGTNIGSVYIDVDQNELSAVGSDYCILFSSSSTTYTNWFGLRRTTTGIYVNNVNGSASSNYIMNSGNNSYNKFAFSFNATSWNYSVNGNSISTLTPTTPIGSIYMKIGALQTTTYGRIAVRKVAFYPIALPIDQLQALTT